ncbi:MAG: hypothetical protein JWN62_932 [Acidimicrobiales bacterium]|nr:hypothetical protein [Acidimicrobiales bacterium]
MIVLAAAGWMTTSGAASADPAATCADGGVCSLGDVGPGGGIVFFVKGQGPFSASRVEPDTTPACVADSTACSPHTISVALTAEQQAALPFDVLEVAPVAAQVSRAWSTTTSDITAADASLIGSGQGDTQSVLAASPTEDNASTYALASSTSTASDWYLPSADELALILIRAETDGTAMGAFGTTLWSSTQLDATHALTIDVATGQLQHAAKSSLSGVRPVRSFASPLSTTSTTSTSSTSTTSTSTSISNSTTTTSATTSTSTTVPATITTDSTPTAAPGAGNRTLDAPAVVTTSTAVADGSTPTRNNVALSDATTTTSSTGTTSAASTAPITENDVMAMPLADLGAPASPTAGQQVTVRATDFPAFGVGQLYIASEPVLLGSSVADDFGTIAITVVLPANYTGQHSLVLYQPSNHVGSRETITFASLGAISVDSSATTTTVYSPYSTPSTSFASATPITDASGNVIASTGWDSTDGILQGLTLLLLGFGCLVVVRRRTPAPTD